MSQPTFKGLELESTGDELKIQEAVQYLMGECHRTARSKGWWAEERTFGDLIALMHSELSEALESFRRNGQSQITELYPGYGDGVPIEFADVLIRIFDACQHYQIDLAKALIVKMAYNKTRLYRHGGKTL